MEPDEFNVLVAYTGISMGDLAVLLSDTGKPLHQSSIKRFKRGQAKVPDDCAKRLLRAALLKSIVTEVISDYRNNEGREVELAKDPMFNQLDCYFNAQMYKAAHGAAIIESGLRLGLKGEVVPVDVIMDEALEALYQEEQEEENETSD